MTPEMAGAHRDGNQAQAGAEENLGIRLRRFHGHCNRIPAVVRTLAESEDHIRDDYARKVGDGWEGDREVRRSVHARQSVVGAGAGVLQPAADNPLGGGAGFECGIRGRVFPVGGGVRSLMIRPLVPPAQTAHRATCQPVDRADVQV